eukprot:CAMPEP_0174750718 /NCGR_PEP_ID=MMETSP1094-20130205/98341_1 /TAXON_ID=156173 /ORGANISM="Chrysochromulina brevifilum, Strain UTEX LB 985" /LENGTH=103 /DNA_ID=CAMNT_0015956109 /DNA_START=92 /DNA_END=400 /DNA_ORIENTATION=+
MSGETAPASCICAPCGVPFLRASCPLGEVLRGVAKERSLEDNPFGSSLEGLRHGMRGVPRCARGGGSSLSAAVTASTGSVGASAAVFLLSLPPFALPSRKAER